MANSLLAHLYSRIRGSQEDVATISLQYLLSQSEELNRAFTNLLALSMDTTFADSLQYICQATGDEQERPDMAGKDATGREVVLCEMKFYAGLTPNQPITYLERLQKENGRSLVFICPKARQTSLWAKLQELCEDRKISPVNSRCIRVDGVHMAVITWAEVLEQLRHVAASSAIEYLSDIQQLDGYCAQMDSDAFIPFRAEDFSAEIAKSAERYYAVVDETIELLCSDKSLKTSRKGLKATAYRKGYTRSLYIDDFGVTLDYNRDFWKSANSIETPFWVAIRAVQDGDWEETEAMQNVLATLPSLKQEPVWYATFLALEPLQDATLDEVCEDLKRQILEYINLFRTTA